MEEIDLPAPLPLSKLLDIPPQMLTEIAGNVRPPDEIAADYGYTPAEFAQLQESVAFKRTVATKRLELEANGFTLKQKCRFFAEDLADHIYRLARNPETPLTQVLQAVQWYSKVGDLEPKQQVQAATGSGFSVTINFPPQKPVETTVIDVTPEPIALES